MKPSSVKSPWLAANGEVEIRTIKDLPGQVFMKGMKPPNKPVQLSFDLKPAKGKITEDNRNV